MNDRSAGAETALALLEELDKLNGHDDDEWLCKSVRFLLEREASGWAGNRPLPLSPQQPCGSLDVAAPFPVEWVVNNPLPLTVVSVRHPQSKLLHTNTEGWFFSLRVSDQFGNDKSSAWEWRQPQEARGIVEGQGMVLGGSFRFREVSSHSALARLGVVNFFVLDVSVVNSSGELAAVPFRHRITIRSPRKVDKRVIPTSFVGALEGVGKRSGKRLRELGIETIHQLAQVPLPGEDNELFQSISDKVCTARSPLNSRVFVTLIERARKLVHDFSEAHKHTALSAPKDEPVIPREFRPAFANEAPPQPPSLCEEWGLPKMLARSGSQGREPCRGEENGHGNCEGEEEDEDEGEGARGSV